MELHTKRVLFAFVLSVVCSVDTTPAVFNNQFAVRLPPGRAQSVADKFGFVNLGQIGSLKGYYLFEHPRIHKRSLEPHVEHNFNLKNEPDVEWVMQQREHIRKKRVDTTQDTGWRHNFPDPLYNQQWYLNGGAEDGMDMNVGPAWAKGYTGKGVVVSILDDGIQTNHPDLIDNYDSKASSDINDNDDDPMPRDNEDNKHGTRCAGEVAAAAYNNYCGVGVAYNASIGGVRMLDGSVNDAVEARALSLNPDHIDIYSASWGPEDDGKTVDGPGLLATRAFLNGVTKGRGGKGSIFVWASGNGGRHVDSCNCDGYTNSIYTLSISSATQAGLKPWYLEECSSTIATTYSSGMLGRDKSVASVDMDPKMRPDRICTTQHTGTSASAPLAAGMVALALEANPALTWRDVQHIVVISAKSKPLEKETGWTTNGANRKVSHKFGFGLMDGEAMVRLAEKWTTVPRQHVCKTQEVREERSIDSSHGSRVTVTMNVTGCLGGASEVRYVEQVQCVVSLSMVPRGNLRLVLTSAQGTQSTLLYERPRDTLSSNFDAWPFLSVHFWGEDPVGVWSLTVVNGGTGDVQKSGILHKWQLILYGTSVDPVGARPKNQKTAIDSVPASRQKGGVTTQACHSQCSLDGCYGPKSSQCVTCANYRLNKYLHAGFGGWTPSPVTGRGSLIVTDDGIHPPKPLCESRQHSEDDGCGRCVEKCPSVGYYRGFLDGLYNGVCLRCHESCLSCAGPEPDSCLTCRPPLYYATDLALCVNHCPPTYYQDALNAMCVSCSENCSTCEKAPNACTSCPPHLVLFRGACLPKCPPGTYRNHLQRCADCDDENCVTSKGSTGVREPNRVGGIYFNHTLRHAQCSFRGLVLQGTSCKSSCDLRFYNRDGQCERCWSGCASCSGGGRRECLSCGLGMSLTEWNECVPNCPRHAFAVNATLLNAARRCGRCHHFCSTCRGGSASDCTTCVPGRYYDVTSGLCLACRVGCNTCSGPKRCTWCSHNTTKPNADGCPIMTQIVLNDVGGCVNCTKDAQVVHSGASGKRGADMVPADVALPLKWTPGMGSGYPLVTVAVILVIASLLVVALVVLVFRMFSVRSAGNVEIKLTR